MSSQISTCSTKPGHVGGGEQQVGAERHVRAAERRSRRARRRRRRTGGARRTRGRSAGTTWAPRRAPRRGGSPRRCCRSGAGGAAGRRRRAPAAARRTPRPGRRQRLFDGVEQRVLQQDVLDRVARQRQLGEHRQRRRRRRGTRARPPARTRRWRRDRRSWCAACRRRPGRSRAGRRSRSSRPNCGKRLTLGTVNGHPQCAEAPELVATLQGRRVAVLTGAGLSTDSGIPDYRGPDSPPSNPMTIRQFTTDPVFRQRYWARNHVGWRHMDATLPNAGHRALAALERAGVVSGVITQNVDLLHTKAGSANVVNLHGTYAAGGLPGLRPHDDPRALAGRTRGAQPGLPRTRRSGRRDRGGARRRRDGQRNRVVPLCRLPVVCRDAQARHRLLRRECRQSRCRAGLFTCRRVRMRCWSPGRR